MRRAARMLGPGRMRVLGGMGGLLACGAAGVAVAVSPKPAGAPLTPPVDASKPLDAQGQGHPSATPTPSPSAGACAATTSLDPAVQAALRDLRAATTRAERTAVMQRLTADQRQQVTALARAQGRPGASGCGAGAPEQLIQPSIVNGQATAPPVTNSYVS
jgi:hypothetical protein